MEILALGGVFVTIIFLLTLRRPLWQAILGGLVVAAVLFRIPPLDILRLTARVFTVPSSLSVLLSMYFITYLQRILEARKQIKLAQQDLNGLFHNRKVNAAGASMFIGLLPAAAAMILCGDIVKEASDGYLDPREQAFATSWFRHIPESSLPTYSSVVLMATLSGVALPPFMLAMIVPVLVLLIIGYVVCLHKLPDDPGTPPSQNRLLDALHLFQHLWTFVLLLSLMLVFRLSIVPAILITLVAAAVVYRIDRLSLLRMVRSAFEMKLMLNTFLVLVLKEFIAFSGVLELLPELLSRLPIPNYLVFCVLFFLGGVISGSNGIIALGTPLAFAAIPDGGVALMVLLMCMTHGASLVSPTHVCLVVASDYFKVPLGQLIRKTVPASLTFCALMVGYYLIISPFF